VARDIIETLDAALAPVKQSEIIAEAIERRDACVKTFMYADGLTVEDFYMLSGQARAYERIISLSQEANRE
jgi:hypothetical protein